MGGGRSLFFKDMILKLDVSIQLHIHFRKGCSPSDQEEKNQSKGGARGAPGVLPLPAQPSSLDVPEDVSRARPMDTETPPCHPMALLILGPSDWPHGPGD